MSCLRCWGSFKFVFVAHTEILAGIMGNNPQGHSQMSNTEGCQLLPQVDYSDKIDLCHKDSVQIWGLVPFSAGLMYLLSTWFVPDTSLSNLYLVFHLIFMGNLKGQWYPHFKGKDIEALLTNQINQFSPFPLENTLTDDGSIGHLCLISYTLAYFCASALII